MLRLSPIRRLDTGFNWLHSQPSPLKCFYCNLNSNLPADWFPHTSSLHSITELGIRLNLSVRVLHYPQHRGLTRASICFHLLWPTCDSLSLSSVTSDKAFSISSFVFPFPSPAPLVSVLWRFLVDANFYVRDFRSIQHAWADGKILSSKKKVYCLLGSYDDGGSLESMLSWTHLDNARSRSFAKNKSCFGWNVFFKHKF